MASTADILNMALTLVGDKFLVGSETSASADLCDLRYPFARDKVLEDADWNFAIKRSEIVESGDQSPVFGYQSSFRVPSDCLRVVEVWDNRRQPNAGRYENNSLRWAEEFGYISADTSGQIFMRYVARVEDPNRFTASFISAVSTYLAAELAIPIAKNRALAETLYSLYERKLSEARVNNGLSGRTKSIRSNVLVGARNQ
jgi:hypothetical protein